MVIAVAIDEATDEVRVLADGITYPVLMDPDHLLTELYAISNVPAVVWIDEHGRIARPNANEFGSDMFSEFTGRTAGAISTSYVPGSTKVSFPMTPAARSPTSTTTSWPPACTSASLPICGAPATKQEPLATSTPPRSWHRWTSPSFGRPCRLGVRAPSARSSSSCSRSIKKPAARSTASRLLPNTQ